MGFADWWHSVVAKIIPGEFPNLVAENVEDAINEISNTAAVSASPGFTWGRSGQINDAYLLNDNVASDTAGRIVPVDGFVTTIFVACELPSTATVEIRRRVGAVYTTITSTTLASVRKKTDLLVTQPAVSKNDELCVYVSGSSIKNPVVGLIIKGTL
jgi:hypothetical protein